MDTSPRAHSKGSDTTLAYCANILLKQWISVWSKRFPDPAWGELQTLLSSPKREKKLLQKWMLRYPELNDKVNAAIELDRQRIVAFQLARIANAALSKDKASRYARG